MLQEIGTTLSAAFDDTSVKVGLVIILALVSQWVAWATRLPAIIPLLFVGILVGPVIGYINPDQLFGQDVLFAVVSYAVAIILFEGGLSLKWSEIHGNRRVVVLLVTVGVLITWVLGTVAAIWLLDMPRSTAALFGAILTVSGPTVILPILRIVRPKRNVGSILKWESIVIDPIGAILTVLVFEAILIGIEGFSFGQSALILLEIAAVGTGIGAVGALLMLVIFRRLWIPEYLSSPLALLMATLLFMVSNMIWVESGLLAVTVAGIILGNQRQVSMAQVLEFKENLRVILISLLFIVLAARLATEQIQAISWQHFVYLALAIFVIRPASVMASTLFSKLNFRERAFIAGVMPRGIVAAAISSVFAIKLSKVGAPGADQLVANTFFVIIGSVLVYGLTAKPLARMLKLVDPDPHGVLLVGAPEWARDLAKTLQNNGIRVLMVDTNRANVKSALNRGLEAVNGNVLTPQTRDDLDLEGIGQMWAISPNDHVNSLATIFFSHTFGVNSVFRLQPQDPEEAKKESVSEAVVSQTLFGEGIDFSTIEERHHEGAQFKATNLTEKFKLEDFKAVHQGRAIPIAQITPSGQLLPISTLKSSVSRSSGKVVSLVMPSAEEKTTDRPTQ
jgi:NhaP-type Na+/H+ or K+/H+ antiporter